MKEKGVANGVGVIVLCNKEVRIKMDSKVVDMEVVLMGVKIPCNKGRHFPFCKSQLDSRTFGMPGSTGSWTRYHSKFVVWCDLKPKNNKIYQLSESKLFYQNNLI